MSHWVSNPLPKTVDSVCILEFKTFRKTAGHWWLTPIILASWEAEIGKIMVQGQPRQIIQETPISKITRAKWTGDMAQVVECLLCNHGTPVPPRKTYE
jgi:hypothetical protein